MAQRGREKRSEKRCFSQTKGNFAPKHGFDLRVFCKRSLSNREFFMTAPYLDALAVIAVSLSVLMARARVVQLRTGNFGWVDTIWTFSLGLAEVQLTGIPPLQAQMQRSRGDRYRGYQPRAHQLPQDDPRKWRPVF